MPESSRMREHEKLGNLEKDQGITANHQLMKVAYVIVVQARCWFQAVHGGVKLYSDTSAERSSSWESLLQSLDHCQRSFEQLRGCLPLGDETQRK
jgi:hypothetical protein